MRIPFPSGRRSRSRQYCVPKQSQSENPKPNYEKLELTISQLRRWTINFWKRNYDPWWGVNAASCVRRQRQKKRSRARERERENAIPLHCLPGEWLVRVRTIFPYIMISSSEDYLWQLALCGLKFAAYGQWLDSVCAFRWRDSASGLLAPYAPRLTLISQPRRWHASSTREYSPLGRAIWYIVLIDPPATDIPVTTAKLFTRRTFNRIRAPKFGHELNGTANSRSFAACIP